MRVCQVTESSIANLVTMVVVGGRLKVSSRLVPVAVLEAEVAEDGEDAAVVGGFDV